MENKSDYKYIVVEDEPLIRNNIHKKISQLGLPVKFAGDAGDGKIALKLIKEIFPNFVITDIRMPVMNGLQLAHYLYDEYPAVKCVILTGYDDFKYAQEAIKYGVSDFLLKPIKLEELRTALQKIILNLDVVRGKQSTIEAQGLSSKELNNLIINYLRTNYKTEITLSRLAERLGFSAEYLTKIFKKFNHETPLKFITKLRINTAQQLLINEPEIKIKQIGEYVGYPDPSYFSRVFKSCTGKYPSEYKLAEQTKNGMDADHS